MLTRTINYTDFNGNQQSDIYHFNLTKTELATLEASYEGGIERRIQAIVHANDRKGLIDEFQKIILMAYGEKSEDGKRFVKNDELRESFTQTAAYDALFMELASDENAAEAFIKGVLPTDLEVPRDQDKPLPPPAGGN
jgi:hypothetical protein